MVPPTSANAINQELILSAIGELKTMLSGVDARVRQLENSLITQTITATQRLDAAFVRIDDARRAAEDLRADMDCKVREREQITQALRSDLIALEKRIAKLEFINTILSAIGSLLLILIGTLVWKLITGEVIIK